MSSQKNADQKHCIKCDVLLTSANWLKYLIPRSYYICTPCFRLHGKEYHQSDPEYNNKQRNRYRMRKSAVIFQYGNQCAQCGEDDYTKLTIDHISGGGTAHRKEIANHTYDLLYNNPVDKLKYQVLCYNCNCSKDVVYKDKYNLRDKKKVVEAYGGQCAVCKEDRIERLSIDHKNNDGAAQRKKSGCGTGAYMYRWLIKQNYPQDLNLRVLCFNCNCSKIAANKLLAEELDLSRH